MLQTVKSIKVIGEPSGDFDMFTVGVNFQDGTGGIAFAKSATPPYIAGDLVEVDIAGQTKKGTNKLKIKKHQDTGGFGDRAPANYNTGQSSPQGSNGSYTASQGGNKDEQIKQGMDINNMTRLVASGKSVDEAYSLVQQIRQKVEGSTSAPQEDEWGTTPQKAEEPCPF
jgi:hypothetical protein